jgi:hypothetical protein
MLQNDQIIWDNLRAHGFKFIRRDFCGVICPDNRKCSRLIEVWRGKQGQIIYINVSDRKIHPSTCRRRAFEKEEKQD